MIDKPVDPKYCAQHCYLSEKAKQSVPRWAFLSALGTMAAIAMSFAGWHVASLRDAEVRLNSSAVVNERHLSERMKDITVAHSKDISALVNTIEKINISLEKVNTNLNAISNKQTQITVKQDLVLKKIGLDDHPNG